MMRNAIFISFLLLGAIPAPPSAAANVLFKSGFEEGVTIQPPRSCWCGSESGCWTDIVGTDNETGYSWLTRLWGGHPRLQSVLNTCVSPGTLGNYMRNAIQKITGHNGSATHALYQSLNRFGGSSNQNVLMIQNSKSPGTVYVSVWIKLQSDLNSQMTAGQMPNDLYGSWRGLSGWKSGGLEDDWSGDYRFRLWIEKDQEGIHWVGTRDNVANGSYPKQTYWEVKNRSIPVPVGRWFHVETFTRRSGGSDGQIWAKVNGQMLFNHRGANMGVNNDPINRIFPATLYTTGNMPAYQWIDDVEIWNGLP